MTKTEYHQYLKTVGWRARAAERLRIDNYMCRDCGTCNRWKLQVHHLSYKNLNQYNPGSEPLSDLISLCGQCHSDRHSKNRSWQQIGVALDRICGATYG